MTAELVSSEVGGLDRAARRQVIEDHVAAAKHLTAIRCTHHDPKVRAAALAVLSLFDWEHPCFKLAEQAKDPLDCRVDDLGVVVQVGGPRHEVEVLAKNVGLRRQGDIDVAGRELFHHGLPISARVAARYVAGAFLSALGGLQGRAGLRQAAGFGSRLSDATEGGAS